VAGAVNGAALAFAALLALAPTGCSATLALEPESPEARQANTTDTVDGADLPAIEGRILESDRHRLVVERSGDEQSVMVSREAIRDIDHPGNVVALVGVGLLLVGAVMLPLSFVRESTSCLSSTSGCDPPEGDLNALGGVALATLSAGGATSLTGLVIWKISKAAARD
jgi:hypothetical protein